MGGLTRKRGTLVVVPACVSDAAVWCRGKYYGPNIELCRTWRNDSREISPGDAFVALKGEASDGHLYIDKAVERGASLILIDERNAGRLELDKGGLAGVSVLVVEDTAKGLAVIASEYLKLVSPTVIGITGSVGKTTTRELTACALGAERRVHSAPRSFNTVIGCSLTILAMPLDTEMLVLEFGTNHFGEIQEITEYFPPDFAVITEIAPAHLEGFGDVGGVLRAKMEICSQDKLKCIVYNADNELLAQSVGRDCAAIRRIGVGFSSGEVRIKDVAVSIYDDGARTRAEYDVMGEKVSASAALFGTQHAYNIGYALTAAEYFGVGAGKAAEALGSFKPLSGRGVVKKVNETSWVVDEAYNASPSSMRVAIENVMRTSKSRDYDIYAVLGGMREMGESTAVWHQQILQELGGFKRVFLYGGEWKAQGVSLPENAIYCESMECLIEHSLSIKMENAIVLIKGSNSYGLKKIVALLTEGTNVL